MVTSFLGLVSSYKSNTCFFSRPAIGLFPEQKRGFFMTIKAEVLLFVPVFRQWLGGANPPLSSRTISLEITPKVFEALFKENRVNIWEIHFRITKDYDAVSNTIELRGNLHNQEDTEKILQEMRALEAKGWEFDRKVCAVYELKFW